MAPADEGVCMLGEVGGELLVSLHSSLYSVGVGSDNISKVNIYTGEARGCSTNTFVIHKLT